jgi:hypothetical protein
MPVVMLLVLRSARAYSGTDSQRSTVRSAGEKGQLGHAPCKNATFFKLDMSLIALDGVSISAMPGWPSASNIELHLSRHSKPSVKASCKEHYPHLRTYVHIYTYPSQHVSDGAVLLKVQLGFRVRVTVETEPVECGPSRRTLSRDSQDEEGSRPGLIERHPYLVAWGLQNSTQVPESAVDGNHKSLD